MKTTRKTLAAFAILSAMLVGSTALASGIGDYREGGRGPKMKDTSRVEMRDTGSEHDVER